MVSNTLPIYGMQVKKYRQGRNQPCRYFSAAVGNDQAGKHWLGYLPHGESGSKLFIGLIYYPSIFSGPVKVMFYFQHYYPKDHEMNRRKIKKILRLKWNKPRWLSVQPVLSFLSDMGQKAGCHAWTGTPNRRKAFC
jgi:hypothetical protein